MNYRDWLQQVIYKIINPVVRGMIKDVYKRQEPQKQGEEYGKFGAFPELVYYPFHN